MADIKQNVVQFDLVAIPPRMIVQFIDDNGDENQKITNYTDLNDEDKEIFDSFKELSLKHM
tara:strand:- start:154 stop:336 length:183 start_codon:yes stop_codon:yes gene_type:complete